MKSERENLPKRTTFEREYVTLFGIKHEAMESDELLRDDISLEQPPLFKYVPSYTTYGIGDDAICGNAENVGCPTGMTY